MATGGGYATLKESMPVIGVLVMTKKSLIQTECAIASKWWEPSLEQTMHDATEEERRLTIEPHQSSHKDIQAITLSDS